MAKIIQLTSKDFKGLKAVTISPDGSYTAVGGNNREGKTSATLDAISFLLQGKRADIPEPIRMGEKSATVEADLIADEWDAFDGKAKISRTVYWKKSGKDLGWKLDIDASNYDGKPETFLMETFGKPIDPAPLAEDPALLLQALKDITGLDFSDLEKERKEIYQQRTSINRDMKKAQAQFDQMPEYSDAPKEVVSIDELNKKLVEEQKKDKKKSATYEKLSRVGYEKERLREEIKEKEKHIEKLLKELESQKEKLSEKKSQYSDCETEENKISREYNSMPDGATDDIVAEMGKVEATNNMVKANEAKKQKAQEVKALERESNGLTGKLQSLDQEKADRISNANIPVPGLTFDGDTVYYEGLPFDKKQLSTQQRFDIALRVALASQPKLKTIFIQNGQNYDRENREALRALAEEKGVEFVVELVDHYSECQIVIENGVGIRKNAETAADTEANAATEGEKTAMEIEI